MIFNISRKSQFFSQIPFAQEQSVIGENSQEGNKVVSMRTICNWIIPPTSFSSELCNLMCKLCQKLIPNHLYQLSNLHESDESNVFRGLYINCSSMEAASSFLIIISEISVTYLYLCCLVHSINILSPECKLPESRGFCPFCLLLHCLEQCLAFRKRKAGGIFWVPVFIFRFPSYYDLIQYWKDAIM